IDRTTYLPDISLPAPAEWCDIAPAEFNNPAAWAMMSEIKTKFKITTEITFRRTLARLKAQGLRTIPSRQDKRIKLCYRPDLEQLHAQPNTTIDVLPFATATSNDQLLQRVALLQKQQQE